MMALRVMQALLANSLFVGVSAIYWVIAVVATDASGQSGANVAVGSVMVLLVTSIFMLVITFVPAILSSLIYIVGGWFHSRAALVLAIVIGTSTVFAALTGDTPRNWAMHISLVQAALLAGLYATLWVGAVALLQRPKPLAAAQ